jgi:hypothetical protein
MLKNPSRRGADFEQEKKIESTSGARRRQVFEDS